MLPLLAALALLATSTHAQSNSTATGSSSSFSPTPVTTTMPTPTGSLNETVPGQGNYPPLQILCNGGMPDTFCPGALLQDVQLSGIFADSKVFVDKPTNGTLNDTLAAYNALPANKTVGDIETFVETYFKGEGLELSQVAIEGFNANPAILDNIEDPLYKGWVSIVNSYWTLLIRETNDSAVCGGANECESSLIPLNYTIVVPGGRYREIYYWDSYWILTGLLKSELYTYGWDLLQNFMDLIDTYGFLPNGGRKYYLNRSQPPVFVQMVDLYVRETGNSTILERAIPLMETELAWWRDNRTIEVTSPYTNKTHQVAHYSVINSAPRPEGYVEDYNTVEDASPPLNDTAKADLYAELATGAESGIDYSIRWCKFKSENVSDNEPVLRGMNARAQIPPDLNSLLSGDHALLAEMYEQYYNVSYDLYNSTTNSYGNGTQNITGLEDWLSRIGYHREKSANFSAAVLDLNWDADKAWFYDFNMSSNERSPTYTMAGTFPLWQNITPSEVVGSEENALKMVSGLRYLLGKYSGVPAISSLVYSGLNWDFPNSWPPHLYTAIETIQALGRQVNNATVLNNLTISFDEVASGQFGLQESELQPQPSETIGNVTLSVDAAKDQPWPMALSIELANRYAQAAFCSWYSTGGSIDGLLTQLPLSDLNATGTYTSDQTGVMFEKFNATDTDAAGGGGEYTVQIGFGWTNGVVLWVASEYGQYLPAPTCPLIPIVETNNATSSSDGSSTMGSMGDANGTVSTNETTVAAVKLFQGYRIPRQ